MSTRWWPTSAVRLIITVRFTTDEFAIARIRFALKQQNNIRGAIWLEYLSFSENVHRIYLFLACVWICGWHPKFYAKWLKSESAEALWIKFGSLMRTGSHQLVETPRNNDSFDHEQGSSKRPFVFWEFAVLYFISKWLFISMWNVCH